MQFLIFSVLVLFTTPAFAYEDGVFTCKGADGLPANTYKIETVRLGPGLSAPHLEITWFFRGKKQGSVQRTDIKGMAAVSSTEADGVSTEVLMLGAARLEFQNGELTGCKRP